jgi:2-polyprenyl-3-methyl-5-hydroxy-6-metoxy-1,4-benzoquinol methylase
LFQQRSLLAPFRVLWLLVQLLIAFGGNLVSRDRGARASARGQIVSSIFVRLRMRPGPGAARVEGGAAARVAVADGSAGRAATTKEPQYERLLEIEREAGVTTLGLMTNQVWHEDPRRLTFILARYKFVSKMVSGHHSVAEIGCGDAFGTRIVQQEVDNVTVYDFDPLFVRDIERRQSPKWPLDAQLHDILDGPLPHRYAAIYSLDVMEHIPENREHVYLHNIRASLTEHGIAIIGSPSLESQAYASPQSKVGHVNCKSGRALKMLLERYFHTVFLFSMNDEVVHTGFYPMAHYLFAVCSDRRE